MATEVAQISNHFLEKCDRISWQTVSGLPFGSDLNYSIKVTIDGKIIFPEKEYSFKENLEKSLNIVIGDKNTGSKKKKISKIDCFFSSSADNNNSSDIKLCELCMKPSSKILYAVRKNSDVVQQASYKSHLNPNGEDMSQDEVELFDHNQLFQDLIEENIDFNPSEAKLVFKMKSGEDITVTVRSRVAGCLFVSMIQYPFSGFYDTL